MQVAYFQSVALSVFSFTIPSGQQGDFVNSPPGETTENKRQNREEDGDYSLESVTLESGT